MTVVGRDEMAPDEGDFLVNILGVELGRVKVNLLKLLIQYHSIGNIIGCDCLGKLGIIYLYPTMLDSLSNYCN